MRSGDSLADYGINNEKTDLRAHVCILTKRFYVYPTWAGVEAIQTGKYKTAYAFTQLNGSKVKTAEGYLVPPDEIREIRHIPIKDWVIERVGFQAIDDSTAKGEKALEIIKLYLEAGAFPFPTSPHVIKDINLQMDGLDILVNINARIQVKCDFRGGPKELGGTGHLFLQVKELNPLKKI